MGFLNDYLPYSNKTLNISLTSILTALVCVTTFVLYFPFPGTTGGYFNVGEVVIYISAILFGPLIGGIAGGVGAALADVFIAIEYAPATLVIKFCEGFIVGFIVYTARLKEWNITNKNLFHTAAVIIGGIIMFLGYFIYEAFIWPVFIGPEAGLVVAIGYLPWNILQVLLSAIVAIPASIALLHALPIEKEPSKQINESFKG